MRLKKKLCTCAVGKCWTKRYKKTENPTALSEESGAKNGYWEQKEGLHMPPPPNTTKGVGKPPKGPLQYLSSLMLVSGEGDGTPLQYFCLENPMDQGAW